MRRPARAPRPPAGTASAALASGEPAIRATAAQPSMHDGDEIPDGGPPTPPTDDAPAADDAEQRRLTAFHAAHAEKLRRAGRFAGQGYPRPWIADRFGVHENTVANWERESAYLEGFVGEENRLARVAEMGVTKIALVLPQLIDRAIESALGSEKDSSADRRYLIDKVITPMSVSLSTVEHRGGERFFEPIAQALVALAGRARVAIPAVIEGSVAAEDYGASAEATKPSPPPNGGELPQ